MLMEMNQACMKETGASEEMMTKTLTGEFPDDPKLKQQLLCIGKKSGFFDANGKHNTEEIKKNLMVVFPDEARVEQILNDCFKDQDTPEETAYTGAKCFYSEYHKE